MLPLLDMAMLPCRNALWHTISTCSKTILNSSTTLSIIKIFSKFFYYSIIYIWRKKLFCKTYVLLLKQKAMLCKKLQKKTMRKQVRDMIRYIHVNWRWKVTHLTMHVPLLLWSIKVNAFSSTRVLSVPILHAFIYKLPLWKQWHYIWVRKQRKDN